MKSIKVAYFALLREQAKVDQEDIEVSCASYGDLYQLLSEKYRFTLPASMIQVAVDDEFSNLQDSVRDGAKVVFIPPVAGG